MCIHMCMIISLYVYIIICIHAYIYVYINVFMNIRKRRMGLEIKYMIDMKCTYAYASKSVKPY
jgi:hypothetical protein